MAIKRTMMGAMAMAAILTAASPGWTQEPVAASPTGTAAIPGGLALDALAMMERVSDPRLSPDGRRVLYGVRTTDWAANRGVNHLWLADVEGAAPRRLAISEGGASHGRWAADGEAIYFLSSRGGSSQVWRADRDGVAAVQVTTLPVDVSAFRVAPDGQSLVLSAAVFIDCPDLACTRTRIDERTRGPSTVRAYDALPLRAWDDWHDGRRSHLFVQPLNGSGLAGGAPRDLTPGLDAETPARPLGDDSAFVISPDSRWVVYSTNADGDRVAFTDNTDVFRVLLAGGDPVNLTDGNDAGDGSAVVSPDGQKLAWLANRRTINGDQPVIMVAQADGSNARAVAADWDRGATGLRWRSDGRALYTSASDNGQQRLFQIGVATGAVTDLSGDGAVSGFDQQGATLVYAQESFMSPVQLVVRRDGGSPRTLTNHNAGALASLALNPGETFTFPGWNGEPVQGWVFKPVGYVEGASYPAVYLIHGGPKVPWTNSWSYRWNPQIYASAGYAVVMVNFHGSPGFGQAFTDSITEHWGDRPLEDLQKGWSHALAANPWIDGDQACALGASYGGYMINLMASQWKDPWRCMVNHAGIFDAPQLMNAMDSATFQSEFGGSSWDRMDLYRQFSPGDYAGQWEKPMLVMHGSRDFRVPIEQSLATFSALQRRGVPSRFVHVPDENHWVLKPRNWVDWQREILTWTERWTSTEGGAR